MNLRRALEWRRTFAPGMKGIAAVVHDAGFEIRIHRRHQINRAPAHAKSYDADPRRIDGGMGFEIIHGRVGIRDHGGVGQSHPPGRRVVFAVRRITMIEIWRRADESFAGNHLGKFEEIIYTGLALHDDDTGRFFCIVGRAHVCAHLRVTNGDVLPRRSHYGTSDQLRIKFAYSVILAHAGIQRGRVATRPDDEHPGCLRYDELSIPLIARNPSPSNYKTYPRP